MKLITKSRGFHYTTDSGEPLRGPTILPSIHERANNGKVCSVPFVGETLADGWWKPAGEYHDTEYFYLRDMDRDFKALRLAFRRTPKIEWKKRRILKMAISSVKEQRKATKRMADWNLTYNMRLCAEDNKARRVAGWFISRWYFYGVAAFGGRSTRWKGVVDA